MASNTERLALPSHDGTRVSPPALKRLLAARTTQAHAGAWKAFLRDYSRLLLHVAHSLAGNYDEAMEHYAHMIAELQRDDYRRLRPYDPTAGSKFTTWLVVVARRLCIDHRRQRYGRATAAEGRDSARDVRWRLAELVHEGVDPDEMPTPNAASPELDLRRRELMEALEQVFSELSTDEKMLLTLRFADELPARKIAAALKLPTAWHVYRRSNALLKRLRRELAARGVDSPRP